jgi:hypothetical protein
MTLSIPRAEAVATSFLNNVFLKDFNLTDLKFIISNYKITHISYQKSGKCPES